jgi:glucans biosynthesis protein C
MTMNEPVGSIASSAAADGPSSGERLHALDAVRGFALLLGIVFHGAGSFLNAPEHMWFIVDRSPSTTLTLLFYVLHIFRMATFFFIAGFFARLMFHRRGERGFVRDRLRRIGLPLLAGWPVLIVLLSACVIWGAWVMNGGKMPSQPPPDPNAPPLAFPLTHLWFLYLLLWFYAITLLVRRLVDRLDAAGRGRARLDRIVGSIVRNPFGVIVLALPTCAALMALGTWRTWFGIPTPDGSLLPNIAAFTAFGSAYAFGWFIHRQAHLLRAFEARWPLNLTIAVIATIGCLAHVGMTPNTAVASHDWHTVAYAAGYALAVWSWSLAFVGLALRYLAGYSAVRRYLADSSYWLYLIHMPLVLALQIVLSQLAWPWWLKFPLMLGVAFPIMLISYHYLVRSTFIGGVLNGRRYPRTLPTSVAARSAPLGGTA